MNYCRRKKKCSFKLCFGWWWWWWWWWWWQYNKHSTVGDALHRTTNFQGDIASLGLPGIGMPPPSSACPPSLYLERWISGCVDGSVCHMYYAMSKDNERHVQDCKNMEVLFFRSRPLGVHIRIIPEVGVRRNSNNSSNSFLPIHIFSKLHKKLCPVFDLFSFHVSPRKEDAATPARRHMSTRLAGPIDVRRLTDLAKRVSTRGHPNGTETVVVCKLLPSESDLIS